MSRPPLLVLAPIAPCETGNGLAMRVASFVDAASATHAVRVAVIPVAGSVPGRSPSTGVPVTVVGRPAGQLLRRQFTDLLTDPRWRELLADAEPMPALARAAPPALAPDVIAAAGVAPGTPVHVVRSYLAPLGLAVAQRLAAPWASLDLDDDDETLAGHDAQSASAYHRLVATFAPRFSLVSLASPVDAGAVRRRHGLDTVCLPNAIAVPTRRPRPRPGSDGVLFVGNLTYAPNIEAAVCLAERLRPALQAFLNRPVHVTLAGHYPPNSPIGALAAHPSVRVTGFLDDLEEVYDRADVVVAPLATGSGTRIKLLEAFGHGVPVVTTPIGAAGLAVRHGEHLLVAASPDDMVGATAAILDDPALAETLATAAYDFVRRHHAPDVLSHEVGGLLATASRVGAARL